MIEIKFRVWEPKHTVMVYPTVLQIFDGKADKVWAKGWKFSMDSEPDMVLMQFTGILDTHGKEVYEGDIMRHLARYPIEYQRDNPNKKYGRITGPVEWSEGYWFIDKSCNNREILLTKMEAESYEVIGNIHENGDLLK